MRIGIGYDIHRAAAGRRLVIGGIEIPFDSGLLGHSDSDVLVHALCDALLGALALGDLGSHFPDSDARFAGAPSLQFLAEVTGLVRSRGYEASNIDCIVIAERPKLAPYIAAMRDRIAEVIGIDPDRVSIKAKTAEGLDAVGRGDAIAAHAVAIVTRRPE
jgi:2-C-methyl-D-erythritol 2,4-cyclodiphosphate synthase